MKSGYCIDRVLTTGEAAYLWGVPDDMIRRYCRESQENMAKGKEPIFTKKECRCTLGKGGRWLVTMDGMLRVFGKPVIEIE